MPKGGIPDRWLLYSKLGEVISGTSFIAFKVPLKEGLNTTLEPDEKFTPARLLEKVPCLGLIIDLTFTTRYYAPEEFLARGVEHCKILCQGHGTVPGDTEFERFAGAVDRYLESRPTEEKLIGVHCTHGINRTGYFLCRYMIDRMGFTPEKAVEGFEKARGHHIEREEYLEALGYTPAGNRPLVTIKSKSGSRNRQSSRSMDSPPRQKTGVQVTTQRHSNLNFRQPQSTFHYENELDTDFAQSHPTRERHFPSDQHNRFYYERPPGPIRSSFYKEYDGKNLGRGRQPQDYHSHSRSSYRQPFYSERRPATVYGQVQSYSAPVYESSSGQNQPYSTPGYGNSSAQNQPHSSNVSSSSRPSEEYQFGDEYWDTSQCWF